MGDGHALNAGGGRREDRASTVEFLRKNWRALGMPEPEEDEKLFTERDVEAAKHGEAAPRYRHSRGRDAPGLARHRDDDVPARRRQPRAGRAGLRRGGRLRAGGRQAVRRDRRGRRRRCSARSWNTRFSSTCASRSATTPSPRPRSPPRSRRASRSRSRSPTWSGFTKLGERLDPAEIGDLTDELSNMASEVAGGPVRLVKLIGDAVMLTSQDPEAPARRGARAGREVRGGRGGLPAAARGRRAWAASLRAEATTTAGPVNLASRITAMARPGSVVCDEAMHDALEDGYDWSFAGARTPQGHRRRAKALPRPACRQRRLGLAQDRCRGGLARAHRAVHVAAPHGRVLRGGEVERAGGLAQRSPVLRPGLRAPGSTPGRRAPTPRRASRVRGTRSASSALGPKSLAKPPSATSRRPAAGSSA